MRPPRRPCPAGGGPAGGVVVRDDTDIRPLGDAGTEALPPDPDRTSHNNLDDLPDC